MWWRKKGPETWSRDELIDARDKLQRQIEILESPARSRDRTPRGRTLFDELTEALAEVEVEIGELDRLSPRNLNAAPTA
jgi:hypothetical protein